MNGLWPWWGHESTCGYKTPHYVVAQEAEVILNPILYGCHLSLSLILQWVFSHILSTNIYIIQCISLDVFVIQQSLIVDAF